MTRAWADYPHIRIYSSVFEDEKFETVRDDDRAFAWYVRLLFMAHAAHPAPAYLPRVSPKVIATLQSAGLIAVNGSRFTMSGVAKERGEVADLGHRAGGTVRAATADRDGSGRFIPAGPLDQRAGTSTARTAGDDEDDDGRDDVEAFLDVRRRIPSPAQRRVLDDVLTRHDVTGPKWAADIIRANPHDPIGAVISADRAWRAKRKSDALVVEEASAADKRRFGLSAEQEEIKELVRAAAPPGVYDDPVSA